MSSTKNTKDNRQVVVARFLNPESVFEIPDGLDLEDNSVVKYWFFENNKLYIGYVDGEEKIVPPGRDAMEDDAGNQVDCKIKLAKDVGYDYGEESETEEEDKFIHLNEFANHEYALPTTFSSSGQQNEPAHNMFIRIIQSQKEKEEKQDIWKNSPYKDLVKLQSNNVGNVGEELINTICNASGIDANVNGLNTKKIGGGEGDGKIMSIPVEVKTAHQGSCSPSFQHELGEVPWKGSKYMIFVDISPECIYLTIFKNFDENTYKSKEKLIPYFPTKSITWRKEKGAFKLDTSVKINEISIENGNAIKITQTTSNDDIASFIRKIVV